MHADRTCDILDDLFAHIFETETKLVANLIVDNTRNHDPAGVGERFKARGHVDTLAKNIAAID